jgi:hypothetical protein
VSAEREELLRLVAEIPEEQVPRALAEIRRHVRTAEDRAWPPAWFGIAEGDGSNVGARSKELLSEGFGR